MTLRATLSQTGSSRSTRLSERSVNEKASFDVFRLHLAFSAQPINRHRGAQPRCDITTGIRSESC
jgi:hypothetical protein